jgi:hypothetical protein
LTTQNEKLKAALQATLEALDEAQLQCSENKTTVQQYDEDIGELLWQRDLFMCQRDELRRQLAAELERDNNSDLFMYQRDELQRQLAAELECDNNTTQF